MTSPFFTPVASPFGETTTASCDASRVNFTIDSAVDCGSSGFAPFALTVVVLPALTSCVVDAPSPTPDVLTVPSVVDTTDAPVAASTLTWNAVPVTCVCEDGVIRV